MEVTWTNSDKYVANLPSKKLDTSWAKLFKDSSSCTRWTCCIETWSSPTSLSISRTSSRTRFSTTNWNSEKKRSRVLWLETSILSLLILGSPRRWKRISRRLCVEHHYIWLLRSLKAISMIAKSTSGVWGQSFTKCSLDSHLSQEHPKTIWRKTLSKEITGCLSRLKSLWRGLTSWTAASSTTLKKGYLGKSYSSISI